MIVGSGQDLLSKLESQRTVKVLITLKVRLNLFILSSWVYFVTYSLYCAVEWCTGYCALMNKRVTSSATFFFFLHQNPEHFLCKRLFNRLHCSKLNTCHHCAHVSCFMWLLSHNAQMVFEFWRCLFFCSRGSLVILFLVIHLEVLMGGAGGRSRSQPKYSLHRKSAHSWCLNKVLFIIRMATAALSSTLEHRKVLWMFGDLSLTTSFFYSPPHPRHTHTHIVFSSLICSNGYDSPLPFAKTFNFSFKYICSFFPPPISVSLLFLLICKIGKKQYNVQKINRFDWEN